MITRWGHHEAFASSASSSGSGGPARCRRSRISRGHRPIRRGRRASSSAFRRAAGVDIHARLIGQWLSERYGQQFVIENRGAPAATSATEVVVRAPADGYTLLMAFSTNAINATLYGKLQFQLHQTTPRRWPAWTVGS